MTSDDGHTGATQTTHQDTDHTGHVQNAPAGGPSQITDHASARETSRRHKFYERPEKCPLAAFPNSAMMAMDREAALEGGDPVGSGPVVVASFNDRRSWDLPDGWRGNIAADGSAMLRLPEGMTHLPERAFSGCTSLTSITLPSTLTSVGYEAFQKCCSLREVNLPDGLTSIGAQAFFGCRALTSIVLPARLRSLGPFAFYDCTSIATATLLSELTSIEDCTFENCSSLCDLALPAGLVDIGEAAFRRCAALSSVDLPAGLASVGISAFSRCSTLASIEFPPGLACLGAHAFQNCSSLVSVTFQAHLTCDLTCVGVEVSSHHPCGDVGLAPPRLPPRAWRSPYLS